MVTIRPEIHTGSWRTLATRRSSLTALAFFGATITLSGLAITDALASGPGNHKNSVADNNYGPNDLGNTDEVRKHEDYAKLPEKERNYYEHGHKRVDHDGRGGNDKNGNSKRDKGEKKLDRADLAAFCARYNRGAAALAKVPDAPKKKKDFIDLVERIKKCVDDLLEPDKDPQDKGQFFTDSKVLAGINKRVIGIGMDTNFRRINPRRTGYVCLEHSYLLASLLHELGFPVRQVNVPLSHIRNGRHAYFYQEAAVQVFFDGVWYYFDPYLTAGGRNPDPNRTPDGLLGGDITDRKVHVTTTGVTTRRVFWWRDYKPHPSGDPNPKGPWQKEESFNYEKIARAATIEQTRPGVHAFVTHEATGRSSGWTPDLLGAPTVPDSFVEMMVYPEQTGARLDIPGSGFVPAAVPLPSHATSWVGVAPPRRVPPDEDTGHTNEAIVLNEPAAGLYCMTVWNPARVERAFEILVTLEGGLAVGGQVLNLEGPIDGFLGPGELRVVGCLQFDDRHSSGR